MAEYGLYIASVGVGMLLVLLFSSFKKKKEATTACPLPEAEIMDKLSKGLDNALRANLTKDAFLKEAARMWEAKNTLSKI